MNQKADLQFTTIVYAILALVVLVVIIGVFYMLTKGPLAGLFGLGQNAGEQGDDVIVKINNMLGGCTYGSSEPRCAFGKRVECDSKGKWVIKGDCPED